MTYKEIIAACSQIHTEHINTLCGTSRNLSRSKWYMYSTAVAC